MSRKSPQALLTTLLTAAALALTVAPSAAASTTCSRVAAPGGSDSAAGTESAPYATPKKLADSLTAGQTGCLRGGTYTAASGYVLSPSSGGSSGAPITVTSYPGERAKLVGIVNIKNGVNHVTLSRLDFEGTGGSNSIKIYAADVVLEDSDITNKWRGLSCMMLGSNSGAGQALRTIIRRNTFHDCGNPANGNKDHGIYAANLMDGEIVENVMYNSAAYAIQLYPNAQRTRFAHNVVDGASPSIRGGLVFGGDTEYASKDNTVEQNVIAYAQTYGITSSWGGATGAGNVARNNCVWAGKLGNVSSQVGFSASGNVSADPGFVDRAAGNYRLKSGSACLSTVGYDTAAKLAGATAAAPAPAPAPATEEAPAPTNTTPEAPAPAPTTTTAPAPTTTTSPAPAPAPTTTTSPAPAPTTSPTTAPRPRPTKKLLASAARPRARAGRSRCRTRVKRGMSSRARRMARLKSRACRAKRKRAYRRRAA